MTDEETIPCSVRELITTRVHSVEGLEILLALRDAAPAALSSAELAQRVGLARASLDQAVLELEASELLTRDERGLSYAPASPELSSAVDELSRTYASARVEVLVFIAQSALARVRNGALRTFAEAFRLRGKR